MSAGGGWRGRQRERGPLLGGQRGGEVARGRRGGRSSMRSTTSRPSGVMPTRFTRRSCVVLAALEPAAAQQAVDRAAGARERQAEALGELLDGQLVGALVEHVERLHLRDREVELVEQARRASLAGAPDRGGARAPAAPRRAARSIPASSQLIACTHASIAHAQCLSGSVSVRAVRARGGGCARSATEVRRGTCGRSTRVDDGRSYVRRCRCAAVSRVTGTLRCWAASRPRRAPRERLQAGVRRRSRARWRGARSRRRRRARDRVDASPSGRSARRGPGRATGCGRRRAARRSSEPVGR